MNHAQGSSKARYRQYNRRAPGYQGVLGLVLGLGPLLASVVWQGCAARPVAYRFQNLGFTIVQADPADVQRACGRDVRCCYRISRREMWVSSDAPDCIVHELCHADGKSEQECYQVHWNPRRTPPYPPAGPAAQGVVLTEERR